MARYIALLRGVNVGGKNKINMPQLKDAFEKAGFEKVQTYINSGNVVFSCNGDSQEIQNLCKSVIAQRFGLNISVALVSASELADAIKNAPDWWDSDAQSKHNAIFVISPASASEVFKQVGDAKTQYEKVDFWGNVIFWSAPIATFSHTRWAKVAGTSAYEIITIRNANTAKKLLELAEKV